MFTLRRLLEKYNDASRNLLICYVDFRKAFDSKWRMGLRRVIRSMGYPEKIIRILEGLYRDMFSAARIGADLSAWLETIVGVLQGCILSPLLFNIFLEVVMAMALGDNNVGAAMNGNVISNLRFADDIAATMLSEGELQSLINRIVEESGKMGMMFNIAKTDVQHVGPERVNIEIKIRSPKLK